MCHLVELCVTHDLSIFTCYLFIYSFIVSARVWAKGLGHARQALYLSYIPSPPPASFVEMKKWCLGNIRVSPGVSVSVHSSMLGCYTEKSPNQQLGIAMGRLTPGSFLGRSLVASQCSFSSCEKSTWVLIENTHTEWHLGSIFHAPGNWPWNQLWALEYRSQHYMGHLENLERKTPFSSLPSFFLLKIWKQWLAME